jgi:hypothetical protein
MIAANLAGSVAVVVLSTELSGASNSGAGARAGPQFFGNWWQNIIDNQARK